MFKKLISIYLSLNLIGGIALPYLNFSHNSYALQANIINEVCVGTGEEEYLPVSDERGVSVLTRKEANRDCVLTKEVQGACIKWEQLDENFVIDADNYDAYRSRNHEGALGSLLATIGAYDQLEHLWSGWKGYCEIGTKSDMSWADDPMFWASLVASVIMGGSGDGAAAGDAAYKKAIEEGATEAAAEAARKSAQEAAKGFLADTALGQGVNAAQDAMLGALGTWVGEKVAGCLISGGFDMARNLYQYAAPVAKSDDKCDPVDEFCGDAATQTEESDIITIDKTQYEDMINQHPEFADQIIILSDNNGILSVRYKKPNEMEGVTAMSQADLEEMQEKMKRMQLIISSVITAGKIAFCMVAGEGGKKAVSNIDPGQTPDDGDNMLSVKNGVQMAINMIPAEWLGPYGVLIKAALTILVNYVSSFDKVNTCTNKGDAEEAGTRHEKTNQSLKHNLCHFVKVECLDHCSGNSHLGFVKPLRGYHYCCYDQLLTKVLVVQLKAQLGRGWENCTGITLRDMNFVSFRQCTEAQMKDGIDGALPGISMKRGNLVPYFSNIPGVSSSFSIKKGAVPMGDVDGTIHASAGGYDPTETFQYKHKCIDLTEFKEDLKAQIGDNIDLSDFDSIFSDVKGQAGSM